jgi:hypothetical protein
MLLTLRLIAKVLSERFFSGNQITQQSHQLYQAWLISFSIQCRKLRPKWRGAVYQCRAHKGLIEALGLQTIHEAGFVGNPFFVPSSWVPGRMRITSPARIHLDVGTHTASITSMGFRFHF